MKLYRVWLSFDTIDYSKIHGLIKLIANKIYIRQVVILNSDISNKLKANFRVNIEKVLEWVESYPHISKVIQTQLDSLSEHNAEYVHC